MKHTNVAQKAVIENAQGQVLVLLRGKTAPSNPLKWDLPGGDLEYGEDPMLGIAREVEEETGLADLVLVPFDVEAHINHDDEHWTTVGYSAKLSDTSVEVKISWEHDEYKWVTLSDFLELDSPPKIQRFVTKYFQSQST